MTVFVQLAVHCMSKRLYTEPKAIRLIMGALQCPLARCGARGDTTASIFRRSLLGAILSGKLGSSPGGRGSLQHSDAQPQQKCRLHRLSGPPPNSPHWQARPVV